MTTLSKMLNLRVINVYACQDLDDPTQSEASHTGSKNGTKKPALFVRTVNDRLGLQMQ